MSIWSVLDGAMAIGDIGEIKAVATESIEKIDILKEKLNDVKRAASEYADFDRLALDELLKKAQGIDRDGQDMLTTLNDCTRAHKCNLVPYLANGLGNSFGRRDRANPSKF